MIQSIIFDKGLWTVAKARKWLKSHKHKPLKGADITDNYIHFRLQAPQPGHVYRTHNLGAKHGIKLILEYPDSQEGHGLFDNIKNRIKLFMSGPKQGAANKFTAMIEANPEPITAIFVCREPVATGINKVMSWLSLGKLDDKVKELKYDNIFHAYIVVALTNGKRFRMEKNEIAQIRPATPADLKNAQAIPITEPGLTMAKLIERASLNNKDVGFWVYHPATNNCQKFVADIVNRNHLAKTPAIMDAVRPQDGKALIGTLGVAKDLPAAVTNLAARGQRLLTGDGVKKPRRPRKKPAPGCACGGSIKNKIFLSP